MRLLIRIYDFGVVTVMMRAAIKAGALGDLMHLHNPKLDDGLTLDEIAAAVLRQGVREPQGFDGRAD